MRRRSPLSNFLSVCVVFACAACESGAAPTSPRDAGTASDTGAASDAGAARDVYDGSLDDVDLPPEDVPPCAVRPDAAGVTCVLQVRGSARDDTGAPLGDHVITVCGPACFVTRTAPDGSFVTPVGDFLDPSIYTVLVHGRPDHASLYVALAPVVDRVATFAEPLVVPRYTQSGELFPDPARGGSVTAGDVTLTVPAGAMLEFDLEDALLGDLGRRFRVVSVPIDRAPRFARDAGLVALWALAPFNLLASPKLAVRVANRTGMAPNAAVDFVVMGQEGLVAPLTAGRAIVAAAGHVSADGMSITTDPGEGISYVTWLGVRPHAAR